MRLDAHNEDFLMELVIKQQSERIQKEIKMLKRKIILRDELANLDVSEFRSDVKERNDILVGAYDKEIEVLKERLNDYLN